MDMFSQLPDDIIDCILIRLSTRDAARSSVLSKRWKSIQESCPILDLNEAYFDLCPKRTIKLRTENEPFKEFVERSLQHFLDQNVGVEIMKLQSWSRFSQEWHCLIDRFIEFAAAMVRLKHLSLSLPSFISDDELIRFPSNSNIARILSSRTLTTLELFGCM